MEVVGVEVFVSRRSREEEIEKFENQELEGGFTFAVEKEDDVLAEGFVGRAMCGEDLDHFVCERCYWGGRLGGRGIVGRHHVLFVQNELCN